MVEREIKNLSLLELYRHPPVNSISKFAKLTREIDVSDLVRKYKELMKDAPRRHKKDKKYFAHDDIFRGGEGKSKRKEEDKPPVRKEEHLAGALFNECRNGKEFLLPGKRKLRIIDYQFPLFSQKTDKVKAADLLGVIDSSFPCVIELKVDPNNKVKESKVSKVLGDTPLRALLEGLAYCAIVEANRDEIWQEAQELKNGDLKFKGFRPHLMVLAPDKYWKDYFEKKSAGSWPSSLIGLANKLSQQLEIQILFYSLENAEFEWGGNGKPAKMKKECKFLSIKPLE